MECAIQNCKKPARSKNLCFMHYMRVKRRGSVNPEPMSSPAGAPTAFLRTTLSTRKHVCIEWPFSLRPDGYGCINYKGRTTAPHRLMCMWAHGPKPRVRMEVAHSCGNRRCVNPSHLRWATREENQAERAIHGTSNRGERQWMSKLTPDSVREARRLAAEGFSSYQICSRFNVHSRTVRDAITRRTWAWLD